MIRKGTVDRPPRTIMEIFKSLPEGTLAEVIDNVIYMSPSPIYKHQQVLQTIFKELSKSLVDTGKAEIIIAPFDVYLDEERNAVQPDLIVVLNENRDIIDVNGHIHGVPDVLIEILSPGNKEHDLIKKKDLYERFGVKEYWIIDPDTKLSLCYALHNNKYVLIHEHVGIFESSLLNVKMGF